MPQKGYKRKINILQNVTIQPRVQQAKNTVKQRITSSMYILDEEPAYTDSESESEFSTTTEIPETSESGISNFVESKTPVYSKSQVLEHKKIIPEKRFSDIGVQCDILSTNDKLQKIIQMCASLEATGEYIEFISLCKKLNNRIDHNHHDVYKNKQKKIEPPAVCSPTRYGKTATKTVGSRKKTITSAKQIAGVRKSSRNKKTSKSPLLKPIRTVDNDSRTNMESPDSGQFDWGTEEFSSTPQHIPSKAIKSLARNWMKPNKSFSVLENSICHQNYLSLQHRSTRRLYSPSQWLDSEDFVKSWR